jgi:hypothetical protein
MKTNGHGTNGHAINGAAKLMAVPSVDEVLARAAAHLGGQQRLLADASRMRDRALSARALADEAHRTDLDSVAAARSACSLQATDAELDLVARAEVRESLSRAKLAEAIKEHDRCSATLATAERAGADAQRAHDRLVIEAAAPARRASIERRGETVLSKLADAVDELRCLMADLEADARETRRARELGSTLECIDGLPAAVGFIKGMVARGLDIGNGAEVHPVRWAFELRPTGRPAPDLGQTATQIAGLVIAAVTRPPSVNGRTRLEQAITSWESFRSFAAVQRAALPPAPKPAPPGWITTPTGGESVAKPIADESALEWEGDV